MAMALDGTGDGTLAAEQAHKEMRVYFERRLEERREQPRPDLLQALMDAQQDGDRLSLGELHQMCKLLLIAGFETTVNLIGNGSGKAAGNLPAVACSTSSSNSAEDFSR